MYIASPLNSRVFPPTVPYSLYLHARRTHALGLYNADKWVSLILFFFLSFVETPLQQGDPPGDNSFSLREILWSASSLAPDTVRPDLTLRL